MTDREPQTRVRIRDAVRADCGAISDIYNFYIRSSTCTFALKEETLNERLDWFEDHGPAHPVLVAEKDCELLGWSSLSIFNPREAYARTVEESIYLRHDQCGRGLGRLLLGATIERAVALEHHTVIAGISADQPASLALHRALGFEEVARLREVGFKFGRWIDVVYLQKMLS